MLLSLFTFSLHLHKLNFILLLLPVNQLLIVNCLPYSSIFFSPKTDNIVTNNHKINYDTTSSAYEKPIESSSWSLAYPLTPSSLSSSSSITQPQSLSYASSVLVSPPWTSLITSGSEDNKKYAISESPLSPLSSNDGTNSGNKTFNLYLDSPMSRPSTSSFRTNIYRCDKTMAIVDYIDDNRIFRCELFDLEKRLDEAQEAASQRKVAIIDVSFAALHNLISRCLELEKFTFQNGPSLPINLQSDEALEANRNNSTSDLIYGFMRGVIPGTKWCGPGDIAKDYFDIGQYWEIDLCCRAHDHCPYRLKAFRHGYGLINLAFYTRSHCNCDEEFYRCLKKSTTSLGSTLGNIYFNVMQIQCFKEEEEANCIRSRFNSNGQKECITYAPNSNRKMIFSQPKPYN